MNLTEAENIKKRWQEYTEELYKKDLHDPDNHNGVITVLGSFISNKASGGDRIPVELFQILKDDVMKVLHSICQQIWKTQQWPQDWKMSAFITIPKKAKNVQANGQLSSLHILAKYCSKFSNLSSNSMWTDKFQMYKLDSEKADEPEIKHPLELEKAREFQKNLYLCFLTTLKPLTVYIITNCEKFLKS